MTEKQGEGELFFFPRNIVGFWAGSKDEKLGPGAEAGQFSLFERVGGGLVNTSMAF